MDEVLQSYYSIRRGGVPEVAAAILALAAALGSQRTKLVADDTLGHEICMGIRMGLFGADADSEDGLLGAAESIGRLADSVQEISDSIPRNSAD